MVVPSSIYPPNGWRISRTRSEAERVGWMRGLGGPQ